MKCGSLLSILSLASCSSSASPASPSESFATELAGNYGWNGLLEELSLERDGSYSLWVSNGVTEEGCGNIEGSGVSRGYWSLEHETIQFTPEFESPGLAVPLQGACAEGLGNGLVLCFGGEEYYLPPLESLHSYSFPGNASYFRFIAKPRNPIPYEAEIYHRKIRELFLSVGTPANNGSIARADNYALRPGQFNLAFRRIEGDGLRQRVHSVLSASGLFQSATAYMHSNSNQNRRFEEDQWNFAEQD